MQSSFRLPLATLSRDLFPKSTMEATEGGCQVLGHTTPEVRDEFQSAENKIRKTDCKDDKQSKDEGKNFRQATYEELSQKVGIPEEKVKKVIEGWMAMNLNRLRLKGRVRLNKTIELYKVSNESLVTKPRRTRARSGKQKKVRIGCHTLEKFWSIPSDYTDTIFDGDKDDSEMSSEDD